MTLETNDIQITATANEPGARTLKVEIPAARVQSAEKQATAFYAKRARLPGFRKGRAPLPVVRKKYLGEIRERALRDLIGESWKLALEQEQLRPIAEPHVHHLQFQDGADATFEFRVEVQPELQLDRVGDFRLKRTVPPVTDDTVAEQIEELQSQKASWLPVEGERPVNGQMASVSIATVEDGVVGDARQYQVVLGSGQAIPDLEEQVMTLLPGEAKQALVRYPDDFPDETKRGQTRTVEITLHDVKRQQLPELNDDFAREAGDFDSLDALRLAVREDMEAQAVREADADVRRQLIDEIIAANALQPPDPIVRRVLSAYAQSYGVPDDQLESFTTEFRPVAERQVLRDLIVDHVAELEHLQATEEDLDRRIEEIAQRRSTEPATVYASLQKSNQLREIERGITEERVFDHLLAKSTVENT
jgi:trigger factor